MTYKLSNFLGINNRLPDSALHIRSRQVHGDYLRDAVNVDIDNAGRLCHRKVPQLVQAMSGAHSLYLTSDTAGYLVRDSVLYAVTLRIISTFGDIAAFLIGMLLEQVWKRQKQKNA